MLTVCGLRICRWFREERHNTMAHTPLGELPKVTGTFYSGKKVESMDSLLDEGLNPVYSLSHIQFRVVLGMLASR
jgi:hypothetical protein